MKLAVASLWLPLATEVIWAIRSGNAPTLSELLDASDVLVFTWLGALPLSLAVYFLWKRSRLVACVFAAVLGLLTVVLLAGGFSRPFPTQIGFGVITLRLLPDPSLYGGIQDVVLGLQNVVASLAEGPRVWLYALVCSVPAWTAHVIVTRFPCRLEGPVTWAAAFGTLRLVAFPLWLSLALVALTFTHLGDPETGPKELSVIGTLAPIYVFAWLAAHPLSLGVYLLHRRSRPLAILFGVTLAVLTIVLAPAWSPAGPLGGMLIAAVVALPAWLALAAIAFFQRNQAAQGDLASA